MFLRGSFTLAYTVVPRPSASTGARPHRAANRTWGTAVALGTGSVLQLEDAPRIAIQQQDTGCWAILKSKIGQTIPGNGPPKEALAPRGIASPGRSAKGTKCSMLELKITGLQAQLRTLKEREEEREREEAEPWALKALLLRAPPLPPRAASSYLGGVSRLCRLHAGGVLQDARVLRHRGYALGKPLQRAETRWNQQAPSQRGPRPSVSAPLYGSLGFAEVATCP